MADNPLKYSDFINPDSSLEELIALLEKIQDTYSKMSNKIKSEAKQIQATLEGANTTQAQGAEATRKAASEADKLAIAQKKLEAAESENAQVLAGLNDAIRRQTALNKANAVLASGIAKDSYKALSAQYTKNRDKINQMSKAELENTAAGRRLVAATRDIRREMSRLQQATGNHTLEVGKYTKALGSLTNQFLGAAGLGSGVMLVTQVMRELIEVNRQYEKQNAVLAAVLGGTLESTKALQEQSYLLGATTVFTATEVAALQTELAKLGNSEESILKSTKSVINGSIAMGSSAADTAELVGGTLKSFGKTADDTNHFINVMTSSTQNSALSFYKLGVMLPRVSSAAKASGDTFEQMTSKLAQAADRGIEASSAATALRNIYIRGAKAGLTYNEAMLKVATSQNRLVTAAELFGVKSAVTAVALSETTMKADAFADALTNVGDVAERTAQTQLNTLDGRLRQLTAAWQGFLLESGNPDTSFGRFTNNAITRITQLINFISGTNKKIELQIFSDEMAKESEDNLNRFKTTYENAIEDIKKKWTGSQLEQASIGVFDSDTFKGGVSEFKQAISDVETLQDLYSKQDAVIAVLNDKRKEQVNVGDTVIKQALDMIRRDEELIIAIENGTAATNLSTAARKAKVEALKQEIVNTRHIIAVYQGLDDGEGDMIKKLQAELKLRQDMPAATEAEVRARNIETEAIKKQIEHLRNLGIEKGKERGQINTLIEQKQAEIKDIQNEPAMTEADVEWQNVRIAKIQEYIKWLKSLGNEDWQSLSLRFQIDPNIDTKVDIKKVTEKALKYLNTIKTDVENDNKKSPITWYSLLGLDNYLTTDQQSLINQSVQTAINAVNQLAQAKVNAANTAVNAANTEVSAAQQSYQTQVALLQAGYAANIGAAKKELAAAKKNRAQALKDQAKAQKNQIAINAATQASSLITATANIFRDVPIYAAIPAIALMWGTFAAAEVTAWNLADKAAKTSGSTEYGDGGLEYLKGGSHASGNDIPIGVTDDGKQRKAEGGEALAIINKKKTRKYRHILPDVINSLNKGEFENKYGNLYESGNVSVINTSGPSYSKTMESDIHEIRKQGERKVFTDAKGRRYEMYKNLKRYFND